MRFCSFNEKMKKLEFFLALFEFSDNLLSVVDKSNTVSHSVLLLSKLKKRNREDCVTKWQRLRNKNLLTLKS